MKKFTKISFAAACITFILLTSLIIGIALKGAGNGNITDESQKASSQIVSDDESGDSSQEASSDISQDVWDKPKWVFSSTTFEDKHPDLLSFPEDQMVRIGYIAPYTNESNESSSPNTTEINEITTSGANIKDIWQKLIENGMAKRAEPGSDTINKLLLDTTTRYYIAWERGMTYRVEIYEDGIIESEYRTV